MAVKVTIAAVAILSGMLVTSVIMHVITAGLDVLLGNVMSKLLI